MSKLEWDKVGERLYETGVDRVVLFPQVSGAYPKGVAWNGFIGFTESPSGAEPTPLYANNHKYLNLMSNEDFRGTIEAYMYPDEFMACDGSAEIATGVYAGQQTRQNFGLAYRSLIGNDTEGTSYGYKIHLVYGCLASPSEKTNTTINESPEASTMSWSVTTTPVEVEGFKPTAHIVVDSTKVDPTKLAQLEAMLYGDTSSEASLPMPAAVIELVGTIGSDE